jgi:GNAT superfamily N-acetyltransferase
MAVTIREVTTVADLKTFIRFATELYENCPNYCPPLEFDELNTFNSQVNPTLEVCEFQNFLAYKDGKIVGRISGIINHKANEHWQRNKVRFGWFDFIDDFEVSRVLLDSVAEWGKQKGMDELNGPVGFTDFDHQGLLLEGYEYDSPMASLYNYPYYPAHFEKYGLTKEADWIEYRVFVPDSIPEKMDRVAKIVMEKYNLRIAKVRSAKELMRKFKNFEYFDVIDQAYRPLYNFQPLTMRQKEYYSKMYFPMLNFDFVTIVVNEKDEIVGIGVGMPDISDALRKCKGRLFPFGWYYLLKALKRKKNMKVFDLLLIAVRPDYQNKGVNALFFYDQTPYFLKYGVQYAETSAILEDNSKNRSNWEYFDTLQHKRRRAYIKTI